MKLYLAYQSAVDYWSYYDLASRAQIVKTWDTAFGSPTRELVSDAQLETPYIQLPLHVVVRGKDNKRNFSEIVCHSIGKTIPQRSFVSHSKHVAVSSPEACFVQMANKLPLTQLVQLGFELCGTYATDPLSGQLLKRLPRTNLQYLKNYVVKAKGIKGSAKAKQALLYIHENSASPMETKLTMLLTLPTSLGGYALPKPELNKVVEVDEGWRIKTYRCDLVWQLKRFKERTLNAERGTATYSDRFIAKNGGLVSSRKSASGELSCESGSGLSSRKSASGESQNAGLALEYDSHEFHAEKRKTILDSKRRISLERNNMRVLSVTKQQVYDEWAFDELAKVVAKYLGIRMRIGRKDFVQRRRCLRVELGLLDRPAEWRH